MKTNNTNTKNISSTSDSRRYGLLSMIAMIVGVVIGSGIFAKNTYLWESSSSVLIITYSWLLGSLLVIFMLISFLEIASITSKKGHAGTMQNWSRDLIGENYSKFIGLFFPFVYFPILISALSGYSGLYLFQGITESAGLQLTGNTEAWATYFTVLITGLILIVAVFGMNTFTSKPTKIVQISGTVIKLIPIVLLILLGMMPFLYSSPNVWSEMFNSSNESYNGGLIGQTTGQSISLVLTLLPAILFSYDGFLFAASLQNEAKKPSTYKVAATTGITMIIVLYILMSLFMFTLPNPETDSAAFGNVAATIGVVLGSWAVPIVSFIIFISIATGISGNSVSSIRNYSSLTVNDVIPDKNNDLIKRNGAGVPQKSGIISLIITLVWFIILMSGDAIVMGVNQASTGLASGYGSVSLWSTDMITVFSFLVYTILIVGILINRFTQKNEVDKNKLLWPVALITIPSMSLLTLYFGYNVFTLDFTSISTITTSILQLSVVIISIVLITTLYWYFSKKNKKTKWSDNDLHNRNVALYGFDNLLTFDEALKSYPNEEKFIDKSSTKHLSSYNNFIKQKKGTNEIKNS